MTEYTAITGNVATEPTVQKTQAGATMTRFRVACPNRQRDAQTPCSHTDRSPRTR